MHRAIQLLKKKPEVLLIDGNRFKPYKNITHHCIVKGDAKYMSIAAASILAKSGRTLTPDTESEKGFFYRSDHFEFAKQGVPAFYTHPGIDIIGKPAGYGQGRREAYTTNDYHKVTDQIQPWWDFEGTAADTRLFFELGLQVANADTWPEWKPGNEFKAKRDAMLKAAGR